MENIKKLVRSVGILTFSLTLAFIVFMGISIVLGAWSDPTAAPPNNNAPEPLNVLPGYQRKGSSVAVGTLEATYYYGNEFNFGAFVSPYPEIIPTYLTGDFDLSHDPPVGLTTLIRDLGRYLKKPTRYHFELDPFFIGGTCLPHSEWGETCGGKSCTRDGTGGTTCVNLPRCCTGPTIVDGMMFIPGTPGCSTDRCMAYQFCSDIDGCEILMGTKNTGKIWPFGPPQRLYIDRPTSNLARTRGYADSSGDIIASYLQLGYDSDNIAAVIYTATGNCGLSDVDTTSTAVNTGIDNALGLRFFANYDPSYPSRICFLEIFD